MLDVACFERGITPPEGFLGQRQFLLAARNLAVRIILDRVERRFAAGTGIRGRRDNGNDANRHNTKDVTKGAHFPGRGGSRAAEAVSRGRSSASSTSAVSMTSAASG